LLGKLKDNHLGIRGAKAPAAAKPDDKQEKDESVLPRKKNFLERKRFVDYE
jgi:hypothetical protein